MDARFLVALDDEASEPSTCGKVAGLDRMTERVPRLLGAPARSARDRYFVIRTGAASG